MLWRSHPIALKTLLYYRIGSDDVIDVVRVLHQRMDADRHLD